MTRFVCGAPVVSGRDRGGGVFGRIGLVELLLLPLIVIGIVGIGMLIRQNIISNKRPPPGPGQY